MTSGAEEVDSEINLRGGFARTGIVLLNFLQPGLGLFRLSRFRQAIAFWLLPAVAIAILFLGYRLVPNMSFTTYFCLIGIVLSLTLVALTGSMYATWRHSRAIDPLPSRWSRWYGLVAIAIIGSATSFAADALKSYYKGFYIPAESMVPSLEVGDKLLAKMSRLGAIRRGDILIVKAGDDDYVKRVVALPGDSFAMKSGVVYLNGIAVPQMLLESKKEMDLSSDSDSQPMRILAEQLPGEARPHKIIDLGYSQVDDWQQIELGANQYFFLGDNRDRSADSRFENEDRGLGIVSRERIMGRILFRYWRDGSGYGEGRI